MIIDAARNKQVAIFDNDSDRRTDEKIARYLTTGEVPPAGRGAGRSRSAFGRRGAGADSDGGGGAAEPAEVRGQLDRLIERQREVLRNAEELRRALEDTE